MFSLKYMPLSVLILGISAIRHPIVKTPNGNLIGEFNGDYYSFKGIPYAQPPIGENRFESPKPYLTKWGVTRDATKLAETCLRLDPMFIPGEKILQGSEDCLYLNIYTPSIDKDNLLPVNIHIHGGGFNFGNGDVLKENILMKYRNFIYVTFNYRLGPLGFLSTEDDQISGNMGLKDQRMALKWVKNNIKAFGGDPDKILMTGFSAGSASIEFQLLTPGIEDLVSSAASFSGSALSNWAIKPNPLKDVKKIAELLKCPDLESTSALKKCLKDASANKIVESTNNFQVYNYHPLRVFGPVIESKSVKDAMITEYPKDLVEKGAGGNVPYLISITQDDGAFAVGELLYVKPDGTTDLEYFNKNYKTLLPAMLFYGESITDQAEQDAYTAELCKKFDLEDMKVTPKTFEKLTKLFTYHLFEIGLHESLRLHKNFSESPVYSYVYAYQSPYGWASFMANRTDINFGSVHQDDIVLMYNSPLREEYKLTEDEERMSHDFVVMLESFANTGVPKFGDIPFPKNTKQSEKIQYLKITGKEVTVESLE